MSVRFIKGDEPQLIGLERGQFRGERLFVLGTGPSLLLEDLRPLKNEITWGTGLLVKLKLPFSPTLYSWTENADWRDYGHLLPKKSRMPWKQKPVKHVVHLIESAKIRNGLNQPGYPPTGETAIFRNYAARREEGEEIEKPEPLMKEIFPYKDPFGFPGIQKQISTNPYWALSGLETVQVAIWLGFSKIYLLGFDMNFEGRKLDSQSHIMLAELSEVLEHMKRHTDHWKIQVTNLSQTTADTVLEKSTLEEVLA